MHIQLCFGLCKFFTKRYYWVYKIEIVIGIITGYGTAKTIAQVLKNIPKHTKELVKSIKELRNQLVFKLDTKLINQLKKEGVFVKVSFQTPPTLGSGLPKIEIKNKKFEVFYQEYKLKTFKDEADANYFLSQLKSNKKLLDDLFFEKALKPYFDRRKRLHDLGEKAIDNLWKKKIKNILLNKGDFITLFTNRFDKYPALVKGYNQAEFKTTIKRNGKLIDEIEEFSLSGDPFLDENFKKRFGTFPNLNLPENTIDVFSDYDNFKKFVENAVDFKGRSRKFDSEIKYIYNFLKNHLNKGDEFIIETSNIYKTCGSCSREFLMLQEHIESLGRKVTIIVKTDPDITVFGGIKLKYPEMKTLIKETEKRYNKTKRNGN